MLASFPRPPAFQPVVVEGLPIRHLPRSRSLLLRSNSANRSKNGEISKA
jgi:hypothetical protein